MRTRRLSHALGPIALMLALTGAGGCGLIKPMLLKSVANTLSGPAAP